MKKVRSFFAVWVLIIALGAFEMTAHADVYTHPADVYAFTVPDGWITIDGAIAMGLMELGLDVVEYKDMMVVDWDMGEEVEEDGAVVMLFEIKKIDDWFHSFINISVSDLGQPIPLDNILAYGEAFTEYLRYQYEGYIDTVPIEQTSFGQLETAMLGGEYTREGLNLALRQVIFSADTYLFTLTLTAPATRIAEYESVLADVLTTMAVP